MVKGMGILFLKSTGHKLAIAFKDVVSDVFKMAANEQNGPNIGAFSTHRHFIAQLSLVFWGQNKVLKCCVTIQGLAEGQFDILSSV